MVIGVDFDNTVVSYDELFHRVAVEAGLIPPSLPASKATVRDHLRAIGRNDDWTQLQGDVYGSRMSEAAPFPGALEFFGRCHAFDVRACIVSHKTRYPYRGPAYDLHAEARQWLERHGFFDGPAALTPDRVYFETTKEAKLVRIGELACVYFVDDLPEFLDEPDFPVGVERILFDPTNVHATVGDRFAHVASWPELERLLGWPCPSWT